MEGQNDITELTAEELEEFIRPPDPIKCERLIDDDFIPSWRNPPSIPKDDDLNRVLNESLNEYYNEDLPDYRKIDLEEERLIEETIKESLKQNHLPRVDDDERLIEETIKESLKLDNLPPFVDDEETIERIIKESLKPENIAPLLEEEKVKRTQMCMDLMKFLERTKKYVLDNELVYNVLTDFCGEGSIVDLEYEVFIRFQRTLLSLVSGGKIHSEHASYILSTINVVCNEEN